MRSGNARIKSTGFTPCHSRWLGSKLKPNSSRPTNSVQARVRRCTGRMRFPWDELPARNRTPHSPNTSRIGLNRSANNLKAVLDHRFWHRWETSSSSARCSIPVKPLTTSTPNFLAARAEFFISSIGALINAVGIPISPNVVRQNGLMTLINAVTHRLALPSAR